MVRGVSIAVAIAFGLLASAWLMARAAAAPLPAFIHNSDLFVDPRNPAVVYASFWIYGVYKSEDYGKTWRPVNRGLKNTSVYALALSSANSKVLFAGTHAGGMYRSRDAGETWEEINRGLTTGTVWDLAVIPGKSESVYALTSLGMFVTEDQGEHWTLLLGGVPGPAPDQQMTLFALSGPSEALFLQNGGQLFRWTRRGGWSAPVLSNVTAIRAMPLAFNAAGALYAGTSNGLMRSVDRGATWERLAAELRLPTWIVAPSGKTNTLYVGTDGFGVFKSTDSGQSLRAMNVGLEGPTSLKIFGLAIDPKDDRRLYAASHSIGLFRSENSGETWHRPERFPIPEIRTLAQAAKAAVMAEASASESIPPPPEEFRAWCNKCHGWTHPALDARDDVVWRAAPTPRDWPASVARMATLAGMAEDQTQPIVAYLNAHFGPQRSPDGAR